MEDGAEPDTRVVQILHRLYGTGCVGKKFTTRGVAQLCGRGSTGCKFERSSEQGARCTEAHGAFVERLYGSTVGRNRGIDLNSVALIIDELTRV